MALIINTNVSSLFAQQYLTNNQQGLSNTLLRLSSGKRINNAADDPAGLAIASNMMATINGTNVGSRNGQDGINLVQTAQGGMQVILSDLQTMNALAVQAANGTNGSSDLANLDAEYQVLLNQINNLASSLNFNGISLLQGGSVSIQIGAGNASSDTLSVTLMNSGTGSAGLNIAGTSLTSEPNASIAIGSLSLAISALTTGLATLGADAVNLQAGIQNNNAYATNLSASESSIMDADYAAESSNLAKFTILNQADIAMLAQANSAPSLVLKLLS
jgi:flagellin